MMDGTREQTNQQEARLEAVKSKPFRQQALKRILKYRQASNEVANLSVKKSHPIQEDNGQSKE